MKIYDCIPAAGTFSRDAKAWGLPKDTYAVAGNGAYVRLNDNKWYLDYPNGLGPILLGYNNVQLDHYVMMRLRDGVAFSLQSDLEVEAGSRFVELLGSHVPGWEPNDLGVRWGLSGSDACVMAIRLARAYSSKSHVLSIGYHGSSSEFVCTTPPALGIIPEESGYMHAFDFNDKFGIIDWLNDGMLSKDDPAYGTYYRDDLAAIIIEQPSVEPAEGYYDFLKFVCEDTGALLIIDDVVTGLRYSLGGISEKYGIHPDLICMGKALGNGIPVSALVGKKEYMNMWGDDSPPFCSSTFFGNALSLAAANSMLMIWNQKCVDRIWEMGTYFMEQMVTTGWDIQGHAPRSIFMFDNDYVRAWFVSEMYKRGILVNRPNFINLCHTKNDVDKTRDAAKEVLNTMPTNLDELMHLVENKIPKVLFRNR